MALSFFNQRKARKFNHRPIYWDARKEELEKRIEQVKKEMIRNGEIPDDSINNLSSKKDTSEKQEDWVESEARERISQSLYSSADHLRRQKMKGINQYNRTDKIIKLILMLLALAAIFWFFYYK